MANGGTEKGAVLGTYRQQGNFGVKGHKPFYQLPARSYPERRLGHRPRRQESPQPRLPGSAPCRKNS